jgi:hypothetical protein
MTQIDMIQKAEADISAKEREIEELRHFIAVYKRLQGNVRISNGHSPQNGIPRPLRQYKSKSQASTEIALEIFNSTNSPAPTKEILRIMDERGVGISGENQYSVVAGYLNTGKKVKAIRGIGWVPLNYGEAG